MLCKMRVQINSPGSFLVVQSQICVSLPAGDAHRCVCQHLARLAELYCLTFVSPRGLSLCITRSNMFGHPSRVSRTQQDYCCAANASKQRNRNASFILRYCSWILRCEGDAVRLNILASEVWNLIGRQAWGELSVCHRPIPKACSSLLVLI